MESKRLPKAHFPKHPGIRSGDRLTAGERAADRMRNGMGSWAFVFGALIFLASWMVGNRNVGFDKYPFILLNLILSCLAAMRGAILLIAAKRQDQISSELAIHDYETNVEADQIVKAIHDLTTRIATQTDAIHACVVPDPSRSTRETTDELVPRSRPRRTSRRAVFGIARVTDLKTGLLNHWLEPPERPFRAGC